MNPVITSFNPARFAGRQVVRPSAIPQVLPAVQFGNSSKGKSVRLATMLLALSAPLLAACSSASETYGFCNPDKDPDTTVAAEICGEKPWGDVAEGIIPQGDNWRVFGDDPWGTLDVTITKKSDGAFRLEGEEPWGNAHMDITPVENGWHVKGEEGWGDTEYTISRSGDGWKAKGDAPWGDIDITLTPNENGYRVTGDIAWGDVDFSITKTPLHETTPDEQLVLSVVGVLLGDGKA